MRLSAGRQAALFVASRGGPCADRRAVGLLLFALAAGVSLARAAESVVTMVADFEDPSVATQVSQVRNILAADCAARLVSIPARGKGALAVEIGATQKDASAAVDLTLREPARFREVDGLATFCWITEGPVEVAFRLHDAADQLFETAGQKVDLLNRWVRVSTPIKPGSLTRLRGSGALTYPIEVEGFRVTTTRLGKQTVFLDELQVEHRVEPRDMIRGDFRFSEPTRIYEPGVAVAAAVVLENRSRERALNMTIDLTWTRPDGSVLQTQTQRVDLPASGVDFRSYRSLDFSQTIREPGLYRLVARARAAGWVAANTFETTIAVTASNRRLSRGRATLFGVGTNLLREPELDQGLEISVARDIGANLLALNVAWSQVEPKAGDYQFAALDSVVNVLNQKDVPALLVLGEPPEWAAGGTARTDQLAQLISALADHFGTRVQRYQVDAAALGNRDVAAQLDAVTKIQAKIAPRHAGVVVLPPALDVGDPATAAFVAAFLPQHADAALEFVARGTITEARRALVAFRERAKLTWQGTHWWRYEAQPLSGAGAVVDAEDVLRFYVDASAAGVAGLIWFDLRDDDNDPDHPELLRGLVRRDFSPRTTLLGYASAAARLTGARYAGPVAQTPLEYDSALFISGERQMAVLLPHPDAVLPIALAPTYGVRGELEVQDLERRPRKVLVSGAPPLVPTIPRPLFVTLVMKQADPDPQLGLMQPWLRAPATVFCDSEFTVEVDAWNRLTKSYLQLQLPKGSAVESSFSAVGLKMEAGETTRQAVTLKRRNTSQDFQREDLTLRVVLEGETLDLPFELRAVTAVDALDARAITDATFRIGDLAVASGQKATASGRVSCAYAPDALHVLVSVQDDRLIAGRPGRVGPVGGDQLFVGVARAGSPTPLEVRLEPAAQPPAPAAVWGTSPAALQDWKCETATAAKGLPTTFHLTIPASALGGGKLTPDTRLLLAVRYVDDDADGFAPAALSWGGGLDGSRSTADYRWLRLKAAGGTGPEKK